MGLRAQLTVRDAVAEDWPTIWRFFGAIVRAGESFGYDIDMEEEEARSMWLDGSPSRAVVAVDPLDEVLGTANMHRNRGGPGPTSPAPPTSSRPLHQSLGFEIIGTCLRDSAIPTMASSGCTSCFGGSEGASRRLAWRSLRRPQTLSTATSSNEEKSAS